VQYEVQVVEDSELPEGHDLVIVDRGDRLLPVLLLAGRPAQAFLAMRAWESVCEQREAPSTLLHAVS
jgi:hypothetical protein